MDQGLPVNFENTASTWQNMPGFAAFYTGLQNQAAQDNIRMLQEAYAKDQAFKEKSRPIELNNLMSAGELQQAQAAYQRALGRNTNAEAGLREGVLPSAIEAGVSKNKTAVVEDQGKVLKTQGEMFKELATRVSNPNIPNFQKVDEVMRNLKIDDPDGTIRQGLLQNIDKLPKILADQAEYHFQNDPATKLQNIKEEGDTKRTGMTTQAMRDVAHINADARLQQQAMKSQGTAKSTLDAVQSGKVGLEKAATIFAVLADTEADPEQAAKYREMAGKFEKANLAQKAAGVTGKIDTGAVTGMPTQKPETVLGGESTPKPQPQVHSLADVQKLYPGVPADKLKKAYKNKFGVDLQ